MPPLLRRALDRRALASLIVSATLVAIATVRVVSYQRGALGLWTQSSFLRGLAYQPDSFLSVRFFKVLATPAFISLIYLVFRLLNRGHRGTTVPGYTPSHRDVDFDSPWIRLLLLAVVNLHWLLLEGYKFFTREYPYSPLESWQSNALVLVATGAATFFAMKWLSFAPLWRDDPG